MHVLLASEVLLDSHVHYELSTFMASLRGCVELPLREAGLLLPGFVVYEMGCSCACFGK
jgi:hypothetical protein